MGGMGPPPKQAAQRRRPNAGFAMTRLPAEGRTGEPPEWPFDVVLAIHEQMWVQMWATPQAAAWERMGTGMIRVVARYVRILVLAEAGDEKAWAEVRQLEDRLGLSPMAMLRLRWEISADELAEAREHRSASAAKADVRARLRIVDSASGQ